MNEISNLEEFPTVLDISETLIRSREVVNQSKSLVSKINSFNTFGILSPQESFKDDLKSFDQSSAEYFQRSLTLRDYDTKFIFQRENFMLQSVVNQLKTDIVKLNNKIKDKDEIIFKYEEIVKNLSLENSFLQKKQVEGNEDLKQSKINLKIAMSEKKKKEFMKEKQDF